MKKSVKNMAEITGRDYWDRHPYLGLVMLNKKDSSRVLGVGWLQPVNYKDKFYRALCLEGGMSKSNYWGPDAGMQLEQWETYWSTNSAVRVLFFEFEKPQELLQWLLNPTYTCDCCGQNL